MPPDEKPPTRPTNLHAPWRRSYMDMLAAQAKAGKAAPGPGASGGGNFLREYWLDPAGDDANGVIVRTGTEETTGPDAPGASGGGGGLILLNRYPYANGHLLVALGVGRLRLLDYSEAERAELWSLTDLAVELCERTLEPQGVNVGLNQGAAAGAGVPEHVHVHVVPRWNGDVNFMSVVGNVRVIPSALDEMAGRYRRTWEALRGAH